IWNDAKKTWGDSSFPISFHENGICFGVIRTNGFASMLVRNETFGGGWHFDNAEWIENKTLSNGLEIGAEKIQTQKNKMDRGVRFRDLDNDGRCELIVGNENQNAIFSWSPEGKIWKKLPFALPGGISIVDKNGHDNGLRFVDLNEDGFDDIIFSNQEKYFVHLFNKEDFVGLPRGWSTTVKSGKRGDLDEIPMIVRGGAHPNNGAWFRNNFLWVQNEDTAKMPDIVDRRSFKNLISLKADAAKSPQDSFAAIKVRPGFKVELVASEPLIEDPIAFDWSADGKLWVVEMCDYPLGMDGKGKPGGKIRFLEDTKGDGHYDKSTIFLDGVPFPNGIIPWRKGVIISSAPEIFYAE
ncbi:MAG: DUF7133 domain-containing protein, partial [Limisphaerales bacterium]